MPAHMTMQHQPMMDARQHRYPPARSLSANSQAGSSMMHVANQYGPAQTNSGNANGMYLQN